MAEKGSKSDKTDATAAARPTEDDKEEERSVSPPPVLKLKEERYDFNRPRRGTCVLINNKNFNQLLTGQLNRDGTDVDADAVEKTFMRLGFDVIRYNDLYEMEMRVNMLEAAEMDHSDADCFVCVILSHGEDGYVYGTNGKVLLERMVAPFKGDRCPSLAGKPKLFFIQACRGSYFDYGTNIEVAEDEVDADPDKGVIVQKIPTEADFLMAYSVIPGHFSWRNNFDGSWFIQALCQVLDRYAEQGMELMHMMTIVNKSVAYDFESNTDKASSSGKKQMPSMVSMLTKLVYFKPKY